MDTKNHLYFCQNPNAKKGNTTNCKRHQNLTKGSCFLKRKNQKTNPKRAKNHKTDINKSKWFITSHETLTFSKTFGRLILLNCFWFLTCKALKITVNNIQYQQLKLLINFPFKSNYFWVLSCLCTLSGCSFSIGEFTMQNYPPDVQ